MTVPDENGECLVSGFGQVVGPVAINKHFFTNTPQGRSKNRCTMPKTHTEITVIWMTDAVHRAGHVCRVEEAYIGQTLE